MHSKDECWTFMSFEDACSIKLCVLQMFARLLCPLRLHVKLVCSVVRMHTRLLCILWTFVGLVCARRMIGGCTCALKMFVGLNYVL